MKKVIFSLMIFSFISAAEFTVRDFTKHLHKKNNFDINRGALQTSEYKGSKQVYYDINYNFDNKDEMMGEASLKLHDKNGYSGSCVEFLTKDNTITIRSLNSDFFTRSPDVGDFTIEFYFYLYDIRDQMVFIKRHGPVLDVGNDKIIPQGIKVYLRDGKVCSVLENFFHYKEKHLSIRLEKGTDLFVKRWYHFAITYNSTDGKIYKYLNGKMEESRYATKSGDEFDTLYYPSFLMQNRYPLIVGENYLGKIDEIKVRLTDADKFAIDKYPDSTSYYESDIYKLEPYSKIRRIEIETLKKPSEIELYIRSSKEYFLPESDELNWLQVPVNTDLKKILTKYDNFFQYKIIVKNYKIKKPNRIKYLMFDYAVDDRPVAPIILETKSLDKAIHLKWRVSSENDIKNYKIYYKKKNFQGTKDIILLDNKATGVLSMNYTLSGLENGDMYYIAVTAVDNNQESDFSTIIKLVPMKMYVE